MARNNVLRYFRRKFSLSLRSKHGISRSYEGLSIQYAFEIEGNKYYQFTDLALLPMVRVYAMEAALAKAGRNIGKDELLAYVNAALDKLKPKKEANYDLDLVGIQKILQEIKAREEWVFEIETIYDLAAVFFLKEGENPYIYSEEIAKNKIEVWKSDESVCGFFLMLPLSDWGFTTNLLSMPLEKYIEAQIIVKKKEVEFILQKNSLKTLTGETVQLLQSLTTMWGKLRL